MSYCLNPNCQNTNNPANTKFCLTCGTKLLLKDRYRAIKPIGQGGFGRTFLAVDEDKPSKPPCVIKQLFPQAQGTNTAQKAAELFLQEAMRLDELGKHPQIPELLAYFSQDDRQYLIQEFINGPNLAQELATAAVFNENQIRSLLNDLLPVLQFVHDRQVIHRDIKPENIIRQSRDARLVIVDFGASKFATGTALLKTGTSIGSPEYVAPEQLRGKAIFASDIYSLGATCIHLLTQMSPFNLYDINEDTWIWQQYLTNPVSDGLQRVLNKMLESAPSRRYQSVEEVIRDLNPQVNQAETVKVQTQATLSSPPIEVTPHVPRVAQKTSPSGSLIDDELAEVSSQFLGSSVSKNENQKLNSQQLSLPKSAQSKSQVELELEELKSEFLGSTTPKKSPQA